jgi:hypothetical protein
MAKIQFFLLLAASKVPEGWLFVAEDQGIWYVDLRRTVEKAIFGPQVMIEIFNKAISLKLHVERL